jgi:hypothetical protein
VLVLVLVLETSPDDFAGFSRHVWRCVYRHSIDCVV